jgi:hypothetical protein
VITGLGGKCASAVPRRSVFIASTKGIAIEWVLTTKLVSPQKGLSEPVLFPYCPQATSKSISWEVIADWL